MEWDLALVSIIAGATVAAGFLLKVVALGVIPADRRPSSGMAWLLTIMAAPWFGAVAFLFLGRTNLGRKREARHWEARDAVLRSSLLTEAASPVPPGLPAYVDTAVHLNHQLGAFPLKAGNTAELISDYARAFQQMAERIDDAESFVDVEYYIAAWDDVTAPFFEALGRACERGVKVRLLLDHLGSSGLPGYRDFTKRLTATGIEWHEMLPVRPLRGRFRRPDLRNHRKLVVIDDQIAFVGSQNLTEPGYNKPKNHKAGRHWVDLVAEVHGPVVASVAAIFDQDWYVETGEAIEHPTLPEPGGNVSCQLVPSGPGYQQENNLRLFNTLIYGATKRVSLTSPYFVPDESLLYAVTTAAQRGLDVELFVSEEADQFMVGHAQASYYRALLRAGVRIWMYPAPGILHSKHFTIDDDVAVIGSSNMDMRSFNLNYEISMMMVGGDVVRQMRGIEDDYRAVSRELTLQEWSQRPFRTRYVDTVMRLTSALQ